jgi:hypothetical protein
MYLMILLSVVSLLFTLFIFSVCTCKNKENFSLKYFINKYKLIDNLSNPKIEGFTEIMSNETKIIDNLKQIKKLKNENEHLFTNIKDPDASSTFSFNIINEEAEPVQKNVEEEDMDDTLDDDFVDDDFVDDDFVDDDISGVLESFTNNFGSYN